MAPLDRRQFCRALGAGAVGGLAGCLGDGDSLASAPRDDWPMHGYDAANTGHHPDTSGPDGPVSAQWTRDVGSRVAPAVRDGLVYHTDESAGLAAFDPTDGSAEWRYDTADAVDAAIAAVDGAVYATDSGDSGNATLYAVDAASGDELWTHEFDGARGMAPVVADVSGGTDSSSDSSTDRIVIAGSRDGHLAAFDAETGDRQWRTLPPTASTSSEASFGSSPAVVDDLVYVAGDGGHVYALDASDGSERWTTEVSSEDAVTTPPTVRDGSVYVGILDGRVYALDAASGEQTWKSERLEQIVGLAIASGRLFACGHATLYALDAATGETAWEGDPHGSYWYEAPVVADGLVYIAAGSGAFLAHDAESGDVMWVFETEPPADVGPAAPVVVDGVAFFGDATGFYALTSE